MADTADSFLEHYGIPGMRWGKRKGSSGSTFTRAKAKASVPDSEDHVKARELKSKKLSTMSNNELKALNSRLQLEKTYSELMATQSTRSNGQKFIKKALLVGGQAQQMYALANSPVVKALRASLV